MSFKAVKRNYIYDNNNNNNNNNNQSAVPKIGHHFAEATCLCNDCQAAFVNKNLNMNFSF